MRLQPLEDKVAEQAEIERSKGTQFDPDMADAFLRNRDSY